MKIQNSRKKRIGAVLGAAALTMSLGVPAFATGEDSNAQDVSTESTIVQDEASSDLIIPFDGVVILDNEIVTVELAQFYQEEVNWADEGKQIEKNFTLKVFNKSDSGIMFNVQDGYVHDESVSIVMHDGNSGPQPGKSKTLSYNIRYNTSPNKTPLESIDDLYDFECEIETISFNEDRSELVGGSNVVANIAFENFVSPSTASQSEDLSESVVQESSSDKGSNEGEQSKNPAKKASKISLTEADLTKVMIIDDLSFLYPDNYQLSMSKNDMLQITSPDQNLVMLVGSRENADQIASYDELKKLAEGLIPENAKDVVSEDVTINKASVNRITYTVDAENGEQTQADQCVVNCIYTEDTSYIVIIIAQGEGAEKAITTLENTLAVGTEADNKVFAKNMENFALKDKKVDALSSLATSILNKEGAAVFKNPELAEPLDQAHADLLAYVNEWDAQVAEAHASEPYTEESLKAFNEASQEAHAIAKSKKSAADDIEAAKAAYDEAWYGLTKEGAADSATTEIIDAALQGTWSLDGGAFTFNAGSLVLSAQGSTMDGSYEINTSESVVKGKFTTVDGAEVSTTIPYEYKDGTLVIYNNNGEAFVKE